MACYPCTHCNKCGMYSISAVTVCAACGTQIPVGKKECPKCGGVKFTTAAVQAPPPPGTRASKS